MDKNWVKSTHHLMQIMIKREVKRLQNKRHLIQILIKANSHENRDINVLDFPGKIKNNVEVRFKDPVQKKTHDKISNSFRQASSAKLLKAL